MDEEQEKQFLDSLARRIWKARKEGVTRCGVRRGSWFFKLPHHRRWLIRSPRSISLRRDWRDGVYAVEQGV